MLRPPGVLEAQPDLLQMPQVLAAQAVQFLAVKDQLVLLTLDSAAMVAVVEQVINFLQVVLVAMADSMVVAVVVVVVEPQQVARAARAVLDLLEFGAGNDIK